MTKEQNTKIITGEVRFSYAHVWEPHEMQGSDTPKYSVSLVIPKKDKKTIESIEKAIEAAKKTGATSKWGGKTPKNLKMPLRDGDEEREDDEVYANAYFVNASCYTKPGLVYKNGQPIIDSTDLYSGCYGYASMNFYPYAVNGSNGIACGLNNLMKTRDGEPLGGRSRAEDDFADLIEDDGFVDLTEEEDFLG